MALHRIPCNSEIPTHRCLEDVVAPLYIQTPSCDITLAEIKPTKLFTSLFNPKSRNNLWRRVKRYNNESLTIAASDRYENLITIATYITFIISLIVMFHTYTLGASQVYVFNNPEDANDETKRKKLEEVNNTIDGSTMAMIGLATSAIPVIIETWRIFKRTTMPKQRSVMNRTSVQNFKDPSEASYTHNPNTGYTVENIEKNRGMKWNEIAMRNVGRGKVAIDR